MQALDNYIDKIKSLPPAPRVLSQLLVLLKEVNINASQIVKLVACDPALTAKVLQRCNNAAAGLDRPIADLDDAVTHLGFNSIYSLVAMVIGEGLLGSEQEGYGMGAGALWQHSVTTAVAARVIARKSGAEESVAFTAGLLHDIGKLVLSAFLAGARPILRSQRAASNLSFLQAEKSILGVEHAEIGGRVLARWNFPENLVKAVWHHHHPAEARPHHQLAACVHLGDIIAHCLGHAEGFDSFAMHPQADALQILEIGPAEVDFLILETDIALVEYKEFCARL